MCVVFLVILYHSFVFMSERFSQQLLTAIPANVNKFTLKLEHLSDMHNKFKQVELQEMDLIEMTIL